MCGCEDGYFYGELLICVKCQLCKRGRGVVKNCTVTSDTVCGLCEKVRTFFSVFYAFLFYISTCAYLKGNFVNRQLIRVALDQNRKIFSKMSCKGIKKVLIYPVRNVQLHRIYGHFTQTYLQIY